MEHRRRWIALGVAAGLVLALPVAGLAQQRFVDVADDNPHAPGIGFVADAGITVGCTPDGSEFCPEDALTRQQMASFLFRASGYDPAVGPVFNALNTSLVNGEFMFTGFEDYDLDGGAPTECTTTNMGEPVPMEAVTITHHATAVPDGPTSLVNVAVDVDRDDTDGDYDVCFTRVDGEDLDAGTYETTYQAAVLVFGGAPVDPDDDFVPAEAGEVGVDRATAEALREARGR